MRGSSRRGLPDSRHGARDLVGAPLQAQTKTCRHEQPYGTKHDSALGGPQPCRMLRSHVDQRGQSRLRRCHFMVNWLGRQTLNAGNRAGPSSLLGLSPCRSRKGAILALLAVLALTSAASYPDGMVRRSRCRSARLGWARSGRSCLPELPNRGLHYLVTRTSGPQGFVEHRRGLHRQ